MGDELRNLDALGERWRAGDTSVLDELVRHRARDQIKRGLESEYEVARLSVQEYGDAAIVPLIDKLAAAAPEPPPLGVIEALGEIGDQRAVEPLRTVADSHPSDLARTWAREALEKIAARGSS